MLASCGEAQNGSECMDLRLHQHRTGEMKGSTSSHAIHRLIWYEQHGDVEHAIVCEKRIKHWNRDWKLNLIEQANPEWLDLAPGLGFQPVASVV